MKKAIAIDFDGTIVENRFPHIGRVKPHAEYAILWLQDNFDIVYLWTCRYGETLTNAQDFLKSRAIFLDDPQEWEGIKKVAQLYIDDRGVPAFLGWLSTMYIISKVEHKELPDDFPYQELQEELDMEYSEAIKFLDNLIRFYPESYF